MTQAQPSRAGLEKSERAFRDEMQEAARSHQILGRRLTELADAAFAESVIRGAEVSGMALRVTPHVLGLINWTDPVADPVRRQFLTLVEEIEEDHPLATLDALAEQSDSPAPGLIVRHPDRALLVALDVCPVYCRYCTRSYSVGAATATIPDKVTMPINPQRWSQALKWVSEHVSVREVIVSGGDIWTLAPRHLEQLGTAVLSIPHVRRLRFSTRGLTAAPGRLVNDGPWRRGFAEMSEDAQRRGKRLAVHTHFNVAAEVDAQAASALEVLDTLRVAVRNHSVLLHGVNDIPAAVTSLAIRLGDLGVVPYYLFVGDLVPGSEHLRTSVADAMAIERQILGVLPGYDIPRVIVDLPGGGGKRPVHTFDSYDRSSGLSVWSAPAVKPGRFLVADPLRYLESDEADAWRHADDPTAFAVSLANPPVVLR